MQVLPRSFYQRHTKIVAREILGKVLIHKTPQGEISGRIVEAEAYFGNGDAASHAYKRTSRSEVMFGQAGHAYVYFNYGVHWLFNVVTETIDVPGAVLIRAVEPLEGIELMVRNRFKNKKSKSLRVEVENSNSGNENSKPILNLTSGPAKLTEAMGIGKKHNRKDLTRGKLTIGQDEISKQKDSVVATARIGISVAKDDLLRYYIKGSAWISKKAKGKTKKAKQQLEIQNRR